jgi:large subunit ribosomal protein L32
MPAPKRRHSRSRSRKRRTHWKVKAPHYIMCSNCGNPTLPHRVCPHCGFYEGRQVVKPKVEE